MKTLLLNFECPCCGKISAVTVTETKYLRWTVGGELAQNVWPEMSATDRETLISGYCADCQKKFFG